MTEVLAPDDMHTARSAEGNDGAASAPRLPRASLGGDGVYMPPAKRRQLMEAAAASQKDTVDSSQKH
jgi:hypothetical protein